MKFLFDDEKAKAAKLTPQPSAVLVETKCLQVVIRRRGGNSSLIDNPNHTSVPESSKRPNYSVWKEATALAVTG